MRNSTKVQSMINKENSTQVNQLLTAVKKIKSPKTMQSAMIYSDFNLLIDLHDFAKQLKGLDSNKKIKLIKLINSLFLKQN